MLIREGGYYRSRNGSVHGPMNRSDDTHFPWDDDCNNRWRENGEFNAVTCESSYDLISKVYVSDTPPEPHQAPIPAREAEYRKVWLDVAIRLWANPRETEVNPCFDAADTFLAELKRRDGSV